METKQTENNVVSGQWKDKKGFDFQERLSLKINQNEAQKYKRRKKRRNLKASTLQPENLNAGLKKLRKKVREVYDEDDEDEGEYFFAPQPQFDLEDQDRELFNALTPDEKRMLKQQETIDQVKMQQTAGKMEALQTANLLAKEVMNRGLNKVDLNKELQSAVFDPQETHDKFVEKKIGAKLGLKGKIEDGKIIQAARGIKTVQQIGGEKATKDLEMKEVVRIGEGKYSERELAKLILEKSGQDVEKYQPKKKQKEKKSELKHLKPVRPNPRLQKGAEY